MEKLIDFWADMVSSFSKNIDDIPAKIKSSVISKLYDSGFITNNDLDEVKDAKISEMSDICEDTIVSGSDITLSDGNSYHFSFKYTDQTMISKLNDKALAGETFLPWHSDSGTCQIYSAEDITTIYNTMETIITYQTTYFNSLRDYINSLNSIDDILGIEYGTNIPEDYQSEVYKLLFQQ